MEANIICLDLMLSKMPNGFRKCRHKEIRHEIIGEYRERLTRQSVNYFSNFLINTMPSDNFRKIKTIFDPN